MEAVARKMPRKKKGTRLAARHKAMARFFKKMGFMIEEARTGQELTQESLAEMTGYSKAYIAELELGNKQPTISCLATIANAVGLDIWELLPATYKG